MRRDEAPTSCLRYDWSHEDHVYSRPAWGVRVARRELRRVRSPEHAGYRVTALMPGISTVITKVYSKLRGRACAWETSGLFRTQLQVPISQADEEYLQAWHVPHGHAWPRMKGERPAFLRLLQKHEDWVRRTWKKILPL